MFRPNIKHTLVTFKICPFCIRVVALMHLKSIDIDIRFIEISNKPDWFIQKSPLGKVPILIIGEDGIVNINQVVLFESNVIMEYLDDLQKPHLMPADPIERALDRSRMEYANEVIKAFHQFAFSCDQEKFNKGRENLCKVFEKVETWLSESRFFHGNEVSLIDLCYAPVCISMCLLMQLMPCDFIRKYPKVHEYIKTITKLPCVQKAKVPDYEQLVLAGIRQCNTYLYRSNPQVFKCRNQ